MDFYSLQFFIFFFIVVAVYFMTPGRFRWTILLVASYGFYGAFKTKYLVFIIFSTLIAYFTALLMGREKEKSVRRTYLLISLACNLGLLLVMKYHNFFIDSLVTVLGLFEIHYKSRFLKIVAPLGISFYIIQIVSYSIDVYRGQKSPEKHLGVFALYVAFFPKLLAGPIERAKQLLPQLHEVQRWDWERITGGLKLMVWGLFKKVVIADRLADLVGPVFANPSHYAGPSLVLVTVFYSFQIYCDFSGYSDIAIGISQVFGYKLMDNFNRPYTALSVAEFWRRWHISLSTWLRDYLYIPLGGNRVIPARLYINLMVVFLVCGIWHGAGWTYVAWGLVHGFYLVFGLITRGPRAKISQAVGLHRIPLIHKGIQVTTTFALVTIAWIFFRANSLSDAVYILSHMHTGWADIFSENKLCSMFFLGRPKSEFLIALSSLIFVWVIHFLEAHGNMRYMLGNKPLWIRWTVYYIMLTAIFLLSAPDKQKFIYFQF